MTASTWTGRAATDVDSESERVDRLRSRGQSFAAGQTLACTAPPYVWGGECPGVRFDCSGLVQVAYKVAGIALPRVAQEQYDVTAKLGPGDPI